MKYRTANVIAGWTVFLVAFITYFLTKEPTASFWDCGEFIAASFKLEVGHPPGAPFFLLMARFFSLFAGSDTSQVAWWVNTMTALASGLTILFLYWTIAHLARKIVVRDSEMNPVRMSIVIGSALLGSLAYTFSDTFWFSAVEAEVYGTSSLITAFVFWAILKWENVADQKHANRWLILIAYLMGLSIGVHLLNLLAIPAIVLVYYFRKYKVSRKGIIYSLLLSIVFLGFILYVIIPGIARVASYFELIFVNGFGLPYNSGVIFFITALFGLLAYGIWSTLKKKKVVLNTVLTAVTVIVIGYFSYALIIIRSNAEPPMDQNNAENIFSLLYYLNREQYGQSPLIYGQYYNAPITSVEDGRKVYNEEDGKYKVTSHRQKLNYDDRFMTVFPRMWSPQPDHIREYKRWAGIRGTPVSVTTRNGQNEVRRKPTFGENLKFFFRYQVGYMYLRYFMWNFAGRQNDMQGMGDFYRGNWLSGIRFIDQSRLGSQENLPAFMKNNPARNRYYMLPLLFGIIGLIYHYRKHKKDFAVVMLLFLMTGLAIVIYLNQYPHQPRERDYAYAGSFYAFSIWIGLGLAAVADAVGKRIRGPVPVIVLTLAALLVVPGIMARENWDDHDRSGRYTTRDFASNYLNSCAPNAILFTNGDNDTFPLWYAQEVEGIRTDVRVVNLSYLGADWYIDQMNRKEYDSDPIPWGMTREQYMTGKRDIVYLVDRVKGYVKLSDAMEFVRSEDPRTKQFGNYRDRIDYIPAKRFMMPIDSSRILQTGTVSRKLAGRIVPEMKWEVDDDNITKSSLMVLDLLDNNDWNRPVYYAVTVSGEYYMNLQDYFQLQGLAYRIVPIFKDTGQGEIGSIDTDIMYDNMMNKFRWGNMTDSTVYLDENNRRMITNFRNNFGRLAMALISENKFDSARVVLDRCMDLMPNSRIPFSYFMLPVIEGYYLIGNDEVATGYLKVLAASMEEELHFFLTADQKYTVNLAYEKQLRMHVMQGTVRLARIYAPEEVANELEERFGQLTTLYSNGNQQ